MANQSVLASSVGSSFPQVGTLGVLAIVPVVRLFAHCYPDVYGAEAGRASAQTRTGVLEGVRLLWRYPYLMGVPANCGGYIYIYI